MRMGLCMCVVMGLTMLLFCSCFIEQEYYMASLLYIVCRLLFISVFSMLWSFGLVAVDDGLCD